jgi:hypothetical protein
MDASGIFLRRDTFNFPRFDFRDPEVSLGFPRGSNRSIHLTVPGDQYPIHQFRHHLAGHFAGFLDNLIQCHRHGPSLAQPAGFDNLEADTLKLRPEEISSETGQSEFCDDLPGP